MRTRLYFRLFTTLACLLGAAYSAYSVWNIYQQQGILGTELLWFWLLLVGAILAAFGGRLLRVSEPEKVMGASVLSGLLLGAGFMSLYSVPLLFVAFVPLLWAEAQLSKQQSGTDTWAMFRLSFTAFFIWNLLSTWWIQNSSLAGGLGGNGLNTIFMCLPLLLYHTTKHHMGQRGANLGLLSYWMTFEIGHLTWDLSWPWLTLGNGFAQVPALVQWYEYTGVFGGTLWILWANIMVANRLFGPEELDFGNNPLQRWKAPLLLLTLPIALSLLMYNLHDTTTGKTVEVVAVQPNFEPHYQKFTTPQSTQLQRFLALSREAVTDSTAYLVFPETSFNRIDAQKVAQAPVIQQLQAFVEGYPRLQLITGISARTIFEVGEPRPSHVFTYCNEDKTHCRYVDAHNAAIQLSKGSLDIPYYQKSKLVPGAEIMPFFGGLALFRGLILDLGGVPGVSLGTQSEREVFTSEQGVIGPLICYESIYGDYVTDYVKEGAEALFVVTNDGWWGNTLGHRQHHYLAALRAIETRRYVVRSANTGWCSFINSRGDTYRKSIYNKPLALRDRIHLREDKTFYVRYGDLIGRVSILVTVLLLVSMVANRLRQPKDMPPL